MHGPYDHQSPLEDNKQIEILNSLETVRKLYWNIKMFIKNIQNLKIWRRILKMNLKTVLIK